ncbi:baseplate wedge subunit [Sinorhizobium phage phiM7]|uniref:Base plate wedge subunit n=3 Tax=Emdodecavirus TaxID=1980937 RepID=S5MCX9_9CAUD|nr:baseplate wedge subunit [Sinorhizobium phage phiM12]YP_009212349.1 baseplate wedge subunit [Sinorhizobium phage phiN3]YP_009601220.1 baseplate wedge subunit [Sinorhizobium phage phiM7]AKF13002.1 baseplate wedge subunit [Sinorhizobium phage phiM19]AGR47774.1 base plate wedge subunit [Sinorhizobium phage phiM12]AKF12642.1 baseplate wedge subunit [Sinorhizobium phage phiM7]AKF13374.1 baseplate wedge subunit [Sinorhizobium phage phiN3]
MSNSPIQNKIIYSDFFNNLDIHPISEDVAVKTNENAVRQSIRNLILTDTGERRMQPNLGGNIRKLLFENFTPQTVVTVKERIRNLIREEEPRANLREVIVTSMEDNNAIAISVVFSVINRQELVSMEVVLERVR